MLDTIRNALTVDRATLNGQTPRTLAQRVVSAVVSRILAEAADASRHAERHVASGSDSTDAAVGGPDRDDSAAIALSINRSYAS